MLAGKKSKKAAFELSVTTIVILVIAMTILILGLVLVRTIFSGATENVLTMNQNVKDEINKLFAEENQEVAVYLSSGFAEIKQGEPFGVAFAIRNIGSTPATFSYDVRVSENNCPVGNNEVLSWIVAGKAEKEIQIGSGDRYYTIIRFEPSLGAPLCLARFRVQTDSNSPQGGSTFSFDVRIRPK